jgi:hypothetical protein
MLNNFTLGLTLSLAAAAAVFSVVGVSAAQADFTLNARGLLADSSSASLRPPTGAKMNQKGLAAIKSMGGQPGASSLPASDGPSNLAQMEADNMLRSPASTETRLFNNLLSHSGETPTNDLLRPPPK